MSFVEIADRVYVLTYPVCNVNSVLITGADHALLIDTLSTDAQAQELRDAVRAVTALPLELKSGIYTYGTVSVPQVSASADKTKSGAVVIALANLDPHQPADVSAAIAGLKGGSVSAEILTGAAMDAHNSFDKPDVVHPVAFNGAALANGKLTLSLPAKSVVVVTVK